MLKTAFKKVSVNKSGATVLNMYVVYAWPHLFPCWRLARREKASVASMLKKSGRLHYAPRRFGPLLKMGFSTPDAPKLR